jgi:ribosomal peptide maturation radical SAM protein 1
MDGTAAAGRPDTPHQILLVSMPWTTLTEPSLGLALLKAVLAREGMSARVMHLNLFLLEHLQAKTYEALSVVYVLNDFLFGHALDPVVTPKQRRWLGRKVEELLQDRILDARRFGGPEGVIDTLMRLRERIIPAWLARWADEIAAHPARLVGFTCMFDQTIASLALARLVRGRAPGKLLALGGYAVRSPTAAMIIRACPWIDAVCDGEGEAAILGLARAAYGTIPLADVPGIVWRDEAGAAVANAPAPPADLDASPTPDFSDFFADIERLAAEHRVVVTPPDLPVENSRGCWWGAKSHCVFCGIRDDDLAYRARRPERVLETLAELKARHGIATFRFADYILPVQYYDTLLPELARLDRPYRLSGEIKANVSTDRFQRLKQAGFREVQPGIESFSSAVLRQMKKGVTAAQNVHTLLLGRRFGVRIHYNLLFGFPDDEAQDYALMAAQLPRLMHLDPPNSYVPVQITRYAPLHTQPGRFGLPPPEPEDCYDLLFSRSYLERTGFAIADFCYYFERSFENAPALHRLYDRIGRTVVAWREHWNAQDAWLYHEAPDTDGLTVRDRRGADEALHRLGAAEAEVLLACADPVPLRALREAPMRTAAASRLPDLLDALDERGLIFRDEERIVSLVLPAPPVPAHGAFVETLLETGGLAG